MTSRTRTRTRTLFLTAAVLAGATAACSSTTSDSAASTTAPPTSSTSTTAGLSGSGSTSGSTSSGSSGSSDPATGSGGDCTVDGEVRGDDTARYIARPATVSLTNVGAGAPPAFYESKQAAMVLSLYAEGAAPANVIWTTTPPGGAETTYTSSPSSTGVEIAADGSGATVKTTLESNDGKAVEVDLTVVC
jgi:hypothetical protein